jgi:tRNA U38,U39,U40 pseudouridine synthase TruA
LLDVGTGKITTKDFREIIARRNRKEAGSNVAPEGLTLIRVEYKKGIFLK